MGRILNKYLSHLIIQLFFFSFTNLRSTASCPPHVLAFIRLSTSSSSTPQHSSLLLSNSSSISASPPHFPTFYPLFLSLFFYFFFIFSYFLNIIPNINFNTPTGPQHRRPATWSIDRIPTSQHLPPSTSLCFFLAVTANPSQTYSFCRPPQPWQTL